MQDLVFHRSLLLALQGTCKPSNTAVGFGLRLDLQGLVHWYTISDQVSQCRFPVSSTPTWVDCLHLVLEIDGR